MEVTVFSTECCASCRAQAGIVRAVCEELGLGVRVRESDDLGEAIRLGIIAMPAIVIDGVVAHAGSTLPAAKVRELLQQARG